MSDDSNPDRYLQKRDDGRWRYVRRIPAIALKILRLGDSEHPAMVRRSLETHDLGEARARRDAMEVADDDHWATLRAESTVDHDAYHRALARARTLKLTYRPADALAADASIDELVARVRAAAEPGDRVTFDAALGAAGDDQTSIDRAFEIFETVIRKAGLARKSPWQKLKWRQLKQRGIANFKAVVGDVPIQAIGREEARTFYEWWLKRIVPDDPAAKALSPSAGNKDMDTMRALWGEYMDYVGSAAVNPFAGLRFADRKQASRPAFSEVWIRDRLLAAGALGGLNDDARRAVLALINTGARPSEIVNLEPDHIVLGANIPHIVIAETGARELKAAGTARTIPLAGVSLEALREAMAAGGFPRYRDRDTLSAAVNKYFRANGLMESDGHTLYSLRHGFEARLRAAGVDEELRRYLMGHAIDRPRYGYSEVLPWAAEGIARVAL